VPNNAVSFQLKCYKPSKAVVEMKGPPKYLPDASSFTQRSDILRIHTRLVSSFVSSIPAVHELKTWRSASHTTVLQVGLMVLSV